MSTLAMPDQESDNESQETPRNETKKHKATELLRREQQELDRQSGGNRINLLGIFTPYVALVATVVGFGVLSHHAGHKITEEIIFYISIQVFRAIPIALIWYWLAIVFKSKRMKLLLDRLAESPLIEFLARHIGVFAWFMYALSAWQIEEAIRLFPKHPRL